MNSVSSNSLIENARVVSVTATGAWLEPAYKSHCGQCDIKKACGQSLLQSVFGVKHHHIWIDASSHGYALEVNDCVRIAISQNAVLQSTLLIYLFPLLAFLGTMLMSSRYLEHELSVLLSGALAMMLSLYIVRAITALDVFKRALSPRVVGLDSNSRLQTKPHNLALDINRS